MTVTIKMFAAAREAVGAAEVNIEVPANASAGDLRQALCENYPQVRPLAERAMFAVNARYVRDDEAIQPGAEVACIPPVSGG